MNNSIDSSSHGLGRLYVPDVRDENFRLSRAFFSSIGETAPITHGKKLWQTGPILDQGTTPHCVGFAWRDWLDCAPDSESVNVPVGLDGDAIYMTANATDGDLSKHDGTSVRAGAQVIRNHGLINSFHWSTSVRDIELYLLNVSPVVLGTNWYHHMFTPTRTGVVSIGLHDTSPVGGHAYLAYGIDTVRGYVYCQNSWGTNWGNNGTFLLRTTTLARLLNENGEACAALGKHV